MPLTSTESRILSLWDSGNPAREIASTTGLTLARVSQVIETYHVRSNRPHRTAMTLASATLRDAIMAQPRPRQMRLFEAAAR